MHEHLLFSHNKFNLSSVWFTKYYRSQFDKQTRMHSSRMRTARSSSHRGGSGPDPPEFPLGCGPGSDPPEFPPLGVGLDLIPLNFPPGCRPRGGSPWQGVSLEEGLLGRGVSLEGGLLGRGGSPCWGFSLAGGTPWWGGGGDGIPQLLWKDTVLHTYGNWAAFPVLNVICDSGLNYY